MADEPAETTRLPGTHRLRRTPRHGSRLLTLRRHRTRNRLALRGNRTRSARTLRRHRTRNRLALRGHCTRNGLALRGHCTRNGLTLRRHRTRNGLRRHGANSSRTRRRYRTRDGLRRYHALLLILCRDLRLLTRTRDDARVLGGARRLPGPGLRREAGTGQFRGLGGTRRLDRVRGGRLVARGRSAVVG
ncbi:hypothetical protein [Amycolatopsis saalfeldensis]|uniref:hypothetical protein n=1 Tax=Amycolatopsis saalfeldensis TaxID=394193 RepID=UPI000B87D09E|nr:hypothetical protein [Amycolatopsis saalfeldensis]